MDEVVGGGGVDDGDDDDEMQEDEEDSLDHDLAPAPARDAHELLDCLARFHT